MVAPGTASRGALGAGRLSPGPTSLRHAPWPRRPSCSPGPARTRPHPTGHRVPDREPVEVVDDAARRPRATASRSPTTPCALVGADDAGLRHGRATLPQLRHEPTRRTARGDGTLPACRIEDWPDFAVRGVMLDVSRDRVPDAATPSSPSSTGWRAGRSTSSSCTWSTPSPTPGTRRSGATPIPSRPTDLARPRRPLPVAAGSSSSPTRTPSGHFERWLRHERYRPLAIAPDGFDWVFGHPPSAADPRPGQPRGLRPRLRPPRPARPALRERPGPHRHGRALGAGPRAATGSGRSGCGPARAPGPGRARAARVG